MPMSTEDCRNKIIHGDAVDVLKSICDRSIDLVVTDPPYGNNATYGYNHRTILGDEHPLWGLAVVNDCYRVLKRNTSAYMFLDLKHLSIARLFFEQYTEFAVRDVIVWDKVHMGMGYGFRKRHEVIIALEKGKPKYHNLGFANVLNIKRGDTKDHPHQKPVELLQQLIMHSSRTGDVVLDPFVGSGSTCVAAKLLGRQYIGVELDKGYAILAQQRVNTIGY